MDVDKGGLEMEKSKFRQFLVVPDVIDEAPGEVCDVVFPSGVSAILGSELLPEEVRQAPKVNYTVEKDALYSLIIADADTQNPDKNEGLTQWQQWVVVNIPGAHVEQGQVLSEYIGSGPLPGSGLHRYVVLVFKQPQR
ncbi:OV-16 antigen-like, partial [Paramacrobiotus metropolitanus]|uniref:OV-16 antigen-like n=1 Tax=Paramacrobiotus metropolitanus TaxID=2943436 RepID=UPI0024461BA9